MDYCASRQTPLRDTYIPCTEPINPYHGNYVSINLTKPWILNLPKGLSNIWDTQDTYWAVNTQLTTGSAFNAVPQWSDICRNFIMPTYCVRTWSNGSYWSHSDDGGFYPQPRTARYPEPQIGDRMFIRAMIAGMTMIDMVGGPRYSVHAYNSGSPYGDFYRDANNGFFQELNLPSYGVNTPVPNEYKWINDQITNLGNPNPFSNGGLARIGGFNLTLFVVEASVNQYTSPIQCVPTSAYLTVRFKPLMPFSDLSGCFLKPPSDYTNYRNQQDWNGLYLPETTSGSDPTNPSTWGRSSTVESLLPPIEANFPASQKCFHVMLPIQLFTAIPGGQFRTYLYFALNSFMSGSPEGPYLSEESIYMGLDMVTVAVRLRGIFLDAEGEPCTAGEADSIHFEIVQPTSLFTLSHTYENNRGNSNRPILCNESASIPILKSTSSPQISSSLLFAPKCGPGMWTNLPQTQPPISPNFGGDYWGP